MSGTNRIRSTLSASEVKVEDQQALRYFVNVILVPIVRMLLGAVNRLSGSTVSFSGSTPLTGAEGLVLVDASGGPVTVPLSSPSELFHSVVIQKTDASANAVTVAAPAGFTINGAASVALAAQWDRVTVLATDTAFYA